MERPLGWAIFETEGRITHSIDLAQVKVICVQANASTGGSDIRISDGPNSFWINVRNEPMTCIVAIAEARKEIPSPPTTAMLMQPGVSELKPRESADITRR